MAVGILLKFLSELRRIELKSTTLGTMLVLTSGEMKSEIELLTQDNAAES